MTDHIRDEHSSDSARISDPAHYHTATRLEHDLLGDREVPSSALYGVQTLRAMENFAISGVELCDFPTLIAAIAAVKEAAAEANRELGLLADEIADAIIRACREITNGRHHEHFRVDMIQGGAGTSTNMNANEVNANRAGGRKPGLLRYHRRRYHGA